MSDNSHMFTIGVDVVRWEENSNSQNGLSEAAKKRSKKDETMF